MKLGLTYKEIVDHADGTTDTMHESVEHISRFIGELKETHPELARKFLMEQYVLMNGEHIKEWLARKMVACMWHESDDGTVIKGQVVTPDEAMSLIADKPTEKQEKCRWDAYVAANAFSHDLGTISLSKSDIMKAAKAFWFHDDDFNESHKVYWYFKDWIFE